MERKNPAGKAIAWSYGAVIAFTAVYFVGGLLLEKYGQKKP
jgi:hypothetical protein